MQWRAAGLLEAGLPVALDYLESHLRFLGEDRQLAGKQARATEVLLDLLGQAVLVAAHTLLGGSITRLWLASGTRSWDLFDHASALEGVKRCIYVGDATQVQHPCVSVFKTVRQLIAIAGTLDHEPEQGPVDGRLHWGGRLLGDRWHGCACFHSPANPSNYLKVEKATFLTSLQTVRT